MQARTVKEASGMYRTHTEMRRDVNVTPSSTQSDHVKRTSRQSMLLHTRLVDSVGLEHGGDPRPI